MKKFVFFFLILSVTRIELHAQKNCKCDEYADIQKKYDDDSVSAAALLQSASTVCKAKGYQVMGSFFTDLNQMDSAEYYLQQAEKLYKQSGCGDSILLLTYKTWAQVYYTKADFSKAQVYSLKVLQCAEAAGNMHEQAISNTMIAQLFNQIGQAEKGIIYTRKAVTFLNKIKDSVKLGDVLAKLSKRYLWHYQDTKTATSLDSSELFSRQQLEIAKKLKRNSSISFAYANLEGIAWERGDMKKALQLLDSSFIYINATDYDNLGTSYYDKADIYIELKQYTEAKRMADSALLYRNLQGNPAYIAELYGGIFARIGVATGDYKMAYEYTEMSRAITDSIRNVEKTIQVTELERKYNQAKNENTIKDLAKKKQFYLLLAVAGLFAAAAIGFFLRQQSLQHKKNILETEQRLNRARMNPHFFFNALAALQKFAIKENNPQAMASNLSKFSHIMRETLESTYKEYVTIEQEMEFLNEYLEVQKIRFPQSFTYEVIAEKSLEVDELLIPAMIIQPFVENSIEHGFAGVEYPGNVSVSFTKQNKDLIINITDNGKGLNTTAKVDNEHISRASQIIKDRIYLLNIKLKTKAGFSIDNAAGGKGVIVKINLPLLYKQQTDR